MKKILLVHILLFVGICTAVAQVPSPAQVQQIKVDELSDEQIRQIVSEMKKNGVSLNQLDDYAQQRGIPAFEVLKLKNRIKVLNLEKELSIHQAAPTEQPQLERQVSDGTILSAKDIEPMTITDRRRARIFGAELFSNKNLTFEPNLRMPTPPNYKLAAGDELIIDVYGYSEVQHSLKVTPEGYVRVPYLGPVYVNGLTIEEAKSRITKQLATIYGGIKAGNTFVQVSLGNIRSIRVLLIGEVVRPGTYTLPSLATVVNALYVSGGPDENGSFRSIQVIRHGQQIVTFDLYDFLKNGDLANNIVLQDEDIVKVNPYTIRVELSGEVKRPAIFEVKEGEVLQDIINTAGGYTDISYKDVIRAYRITSKEREVVNVTAAEVGTFKPRSGDQYFVEAILQRFTNRVMISGAVFHPGEYALESNMSVADLIRKADGLKEDASLNRAIIFRQKDDLTPTGTSINLQKILSGQEVVRLRREDSLVVYSQLELREKYQVKIGGEVNAPGYFNFTDSLHIEDLILMAGGLTDAASMKRVEVSRRIKNKDYNPADSVTAIVAQFDLANNLSSLNNFVLQPFDEIMVRKSPTYREQSSISIEGEVLYPGIYTITTKKEKISDLLKRAGGLKTEAFPEGAMLLRKTFLSGNDSALLNSKLEVFYNNLNDSTDIRKMERVLGRKEQLVGINLTEVLNRPGGKYDLLLEEGDIIKIPKRLQTVQLFGEVYFPKKVRFDRNFAFRDYVRGAGGYTSGALKRRSYIVYANGEVRSTRKVLFFNSHPKVRPGAEIYVPAKKDGKKLNGQEVLGISTGLASLALIIFTIIDRTR